MSVEVTKQRESNFELLRLMAMLLVVLVHANFWSIGSPSQEYFSQEFFLSTIRVLMESLSIVCVNVFVLISGWFGIRMSWAKLFSFLFQIVYFNVICFLIYTILLGKTLGLDEAVKYFFLLTERYWFVKAYLGLMLIAPVLNLFIDKSDVKLKKYVLIGYFSFQCLYGWLLPSVSWISSGSSLSSFAFLYLLAGYAKNVPPPRVIKKISWKHYLIFYFLSAISITAIYVFFLIKTGLGIGVFAYSCPIVIIESMSLFLFFLRFISVARW